jgi:hypothetical protein
MQCGDGKCLCKQQNFILLPCDHRICMKCVDDMIARAAGRRHGLLCPRSTCSCPFAMLHPYNPKCNVSGVLPQACVRDNYPEHFELHHWKTLISCGQKVMGMSLLNGKLYVASKIKNEIYSFDVSRVVQEEQAVEKQNIDIHGLTCPRGMAASKKFATVYIVDWSTWFGGTLWVYRTGNNPRQFKVDFEGEPFGISVSEMETEDFVKIFVTCATPGFGYVGNGQILVYTDNNQSHATLYRPSILQLPSNFELPRHAVQLPTSTDDELAVCHGWTWTVFRNHRVSTVRVSQNSEANLMETKSYGTCCMHLEFCCCNDESQSMICSKLKSLV